MYLAGLAGLKGGLGTKMIKMKDVFVLRLSKNSPTTMAPQVKSRTKEDMPHHFSQKAI